ncbi:MAG: hypothetical protein WAX14_00535 [Rhodococcus sp. (in: high G+C Gram-positive bacteria)]|uniref:hypothetical protein n=1 Tax=Rhodococcus sp. TaxID=1831 RepID=UPI003BB655CE
MWAAQEVIAAANSAAMFFHMGPPMHLVPVAEGTDTQKRWTIHAFAEHRVDTMALTESEAEPEAGSDIGADRTKAIEQPDGTWHIEGVKRFVSGGRCGWPHGVSPSGYPTLVKDLRKNARLAGRSARRRMK